MAKRTRGRALREPGASVTPERARRPRRRTPQRSSGGVLERYRTVLIAGVAVVGVLIIGFMFFQGATQAAYDCRVQMTPGPVEPPPTPRPPTPSPSPTLSPSPGASPDASPDASPTASPTASPEPSPSPTPAPDPTARLGFPAADLGRLHVATGRPITYDYCPPASGSHYNQAGVAPMPPAVYPAAQERSPGYWVHNLEHGYVVLMYRCPSGVLGEGDCVTREEMNQMQAFFDQAQDPPFSGCPDKTLVVRFDSMETRFGLVAWDRALLVDEFDLEQALTFAEQWMEYDPIVLPERQAC